MASTAGPSETLMDRLETALQRSPPAPEAVQLALEQLVAALKEQAHALSRGTEDLESTLYFDPFPAMLALSPLLGSPNSAVCALVVEAIDLFAAHSSGKEMAMVLGERFAGLVPENDDESDFGDSSEADQDPDQPWIGRGAVKELTQLVRVYATVLPRIKALRPANFLSSAAEQILGAMTSVTQAGAFSGSSEGGSESSVLAAELLESIASFVEILTNDPWTEPARDLCLPPLERLLLASIALLHPHVCTSIAQAFFVSAYPRYRIPGRDAQPHTALTQAWYSAVQTAKMLSLTPIALFSRVTARPSADSSPDPLSCLGSFILLTHLLALSPNLRPSTLGFDSSELISKTLRILMSAFGGGESGEETKLGEDEPLFWTWWCVQGAVRAGEEIDESVLFTLVELLSTFASLSPNPSSRFLAFRLLTTLVLHGTEKEEVQLMILKDLVEDCPFEQMRVASIGLLRGVVAGKFDRLDEDSREPSTPVVDPPPQLEPPVPFSSIFLSPLLLSELSSTLLRFEPVDLLALPPPRDEVKASAFLETHSKGTMEKLSLLYLLLVRDEGDLTTVHATLPATEQLFLSPLRRALTAWTIEAEQLGELGQVLELEMLQGGVDRVDRAVQEHAR